MEFGPDKVFVVEVDATAREHVTKILTDAGYQVAGQIAATLKMVLASMPDVIVMGASPPIWTAVISWLRLSDRNRRGIFASS